MACARRPRHRLRRPPGPPPPPGARRLFVEAERRVEEQRRQLEQLERHGVRLQTEAQAAQAAVAALATRRQEIEARLVELSTGLTAKEAEVAVAREQLRGADETIA